MKRSLHQRPRAGPHAVKWLLALGVIAVIALAALLLPVSRANASTLTDCLAHANVCVVGAGIAGITTAYLLAREGKSVVVVDDGPVGGGETGRTTAHSKMVHPRFVTRIGSGPRRRSTAPRTAGQSCSS